jgi:hypothetical protein
VQPPNQLKGFDKLTLAAGASKQVRFSLDDRAFSYWNTNAAGWRVAPGCYAIRVGSSSRDLPLQGTVSRGGARCAAGAVAVTPRACTSRRLLTIRLPRGLRSATVKVNGKRVKVLRGRRLRARIDLRGLKRGQATVRVTGRTARGHTIRQTRRFRTCTKKH